MLGKTILENIAKLFTASTAPPMPPIPPAPPILKQNTKRDTFEKSKLPLLWILLTVLAIIVCAVFFHIIDSNRVTELNEKEKQIQQIQQRITAAEKELQELKDTTEQEKKNRLTAEEKVTELEDVLLERAKQIAQLKTEEKKQVEETVQTVSETETDAKSVAEEATTENPQAGDLLELTIKDIKYRFHWCPPGTFIMGSPKSEERKMMGWIDKTQHQVTLTKGFWMAETETTQEQWEAVMGNNPSIFKGIKNPVEQVSWEDCRKFIEKINTIATGLPSGYKFAFPTETQWEYACRAGTTTPFHFGSELNGIMANCNGNYPYGTSTVGLYLKKTTEVGSYPANTWGLYDMHGNVGEWCYDLCYDLYDDWYYDLYYDIYERRWERRRKIRDGDMKSVGVRDGDMESVTDPAGANHGSRRVYRGGDWDNHPMDCQSVSWGANIPSKCNSCLGLRLSLVTVIPGKPRIVKIEPEDRAVIRPDETEFRVTFDQNVPNAVVSVVQVDRSGNQLNGFPIDFERRLRESDFPIDVMRESDFPIDDSDSNQDQPNQQSYSRKFKLAPGSWYEVRVILQDNNNKDGNRYPERIWRVETSGEPLPIPGVIRFSPPNNEALESGEVEFKVTFNRNRNISKAALSVTPTTPTGRSSVGNMYMLSKKEVNSLEYSRKIKLLPGTDYSIHIYSQDNNNIVTTPPISWKIKTLGDPLPIPKVVSIVPDPIAVKKAAVKPGEMEYRIMFDRDMNTEKGGFVMQRYDNDGLRMERYGNDKRRMLKTVIRGEWIDKRTFSGKFLFESNFRYEFSACFWSEEGVVIDPFRLYFSTLAD